MTADDLTAIAATLRTRLDVLEEDARRGGEAEPTDGRKRTTRAELAASAEEMLSLFYAVSSLPSPQLTDWQRRELVLGALVEGATVARFRVLMRRYGIDLHGADDKLIAHAINVCARKVGPRVSRIANPKHAVIERLWRAMRIGSQWDAHKKKRQRSDGTKLSPV